MGLGVLADFSRLLLSIKLPRGLPMFLKMQSFPRAWLSNTSSDPRAWTRSQEISRVVEETPIWAHPPSLKLSWHRKPLRSLPALTCGLYCITVLYKELWGTQKEMAATSPLIALSIVLELLGDCAPNGPEVARTSTALPLRIPQSVPLSKRFLSLHLEMECNLPMSGGQRDRPGKRHRESVCVPMCVYVCMCVHVCACVSTRL